MQRTQFAVIAVAAALICCFVLADDELARRATWSIPTTADVKARLDDYLAGKEIDEATRLKLEALWPDDAQKLDGIELLYTLTASLAVVEPKAAEVVTACRENSGLLVAPKFPGLLDEDLPPLVRDNLRLLVGHWLDENGVTGGLQLEIVLDAHFGNDDPKLLCKLAA